MWLLLSNVDQTNQRADSKREFPFSTVVTDKELYFKGYGVGLKSTAKLTILLPTDTLFASGESLNAVTSSGVFALAAASYTD
jgi:hypothetical protein